MIVLMREEEVAGVGRKGATEVGRKKPPASALLGRDVKPRLLQSLAVFELSAEISERGSQRERDRERAQARSGGKSKQPKNDGLTPEQRRQRDAKALQEKAAKKAAQAGGVSGGKN
ncbi:hypothetical protein CerSpe_290020 [Prunus speciosa]